MSACQHESRTPNGCPICEMKRLVRERGAVGNGVDETFTSCPYCALLVRCLGDPPTVFHERPECVQYRVEPLESYTDKLRAKIRGAGRE